MKMRILAKRTLCVALAGAVIAGGAVAGSCLGNGQGTVNAKEKIDVTGISAPKYVFMFIGDGMSYPQLQIASDYLGALADTDGDAILDGNKPLNFMNFAAAGSAVTYDSSSFCPDSASTATSLSTGYKTYSGTINMDETKTVAYETIAEKVKEQLGYKVGIISSVNLNHATPAAYYAHQASRSSYYAIGEELIASGFDYFAGGGLLQPDGKNGDEENLYDLAKKAGYTVTMTQAQAEKLTNGAKAIVIDEHLADASAMAYELDRKENYWSLADYVEKGIEVLDNDNGFFMMVEGGKIDWACHANDAASTIHDTLALAEAVQKAIDFYNEHTTETLIVVTGDHETGGLTIGFAGTNYDTFLTNLENQTISFAKYDSDYVTKYRENNTSFKEVLKDIEKLFGLVAPENAGEDTEETLILTEYEMDKLQAAYNKTMQKNTSEGIAQEQYVLYGTYEPLSVTITHVLNNKSGISFSSYAHTGLPVAVLAQGNGAKLFNGYYDNTNIYDTLTALLRVR